MTVAASEGGLGRLLMRRDGPEIDAIVRPAEGTLGAQDELVEGVHIDR